ncbi:MAG: hypothetical protein R2695_18600 [Acidimicrobiales bacterium]
MLPDPAADAELPTLEAVRRDEQAVGFMLTLHGLVHLVGFILAWRIGRPFRFSYDDVWPSAGSWPGRAVGLVWLLVAIALVVIGARMANRRDVPVAALVAALVSSVLVCLTAVPAAIPGAVISAGVLVAMSVLRRRRRARM